MLALLPDPAAAHPMDTQNAAFVQGVDGPAPAPFMYLGAKHMMTGYDHLLFLVGVIFFLYRLRDVVLYVSLFTLGHSITLLLGVLGGFEVNAYVIDAIIGLSVCYKAFENMGGFERVLGFRPNTKVAVLVFGLFHGLGLATKLQEFTVTDSGLVAKHLQLQCGCGDRPDPGPHRGSGRDHGVADAPQLRSPCIRDERGADGRGLHPDGAATVRLRLLPLGASPHRAASTHA